MGFLGRRSPGVWSWSAGPCNEKRPWWRIHAAVGRSPASSSASGVRVSQVHSWPAQPDAPTWNELAHHWRLRGLHCSVFDDACTASFHGFRHVLLDLLRPPRLWNFRRHGRLQWTRGEVDALRGQRFNPPFHLDNSERRRHQWLDRPYHDELERLDDDHRHGEDDHEQEESTKA